MVVKAKDTVTIVDLTDVDYLATWYCSQTATLSAPSAPTTTTAFATPSGWTRAEPTFDSANPSASLALAVYTCQQTAWKDGSCTWGTVSKSTSYEAAKAAYNKAIAAGSTAEEAKADVESAYLKTVSKGEQLVANGSALLGDNTNFSKWVFDGATTNNSPGSFTRAAGSGGATIATDEYFPIVPQNEYTFSFDMKSLNKAGTMYSYLDFYDVDKQQIKASWHLHLSGTTTKLAADLKAGDTVVYVEDLSAWQLKKNYQFITFWNYTNSFGYTYPTGTYSRTRATIANSSSTPTSAALDYDNNCITLASAWTGGTITAGTEVSQGGDGSTYKYTPLSGKVIPTEWTSYSGKVSGVDYSGTNVGGMFPPGTAYAKVGFLWNYNSASGEQFWVTNVSVTDTTAVSAAVKTLIKDVDVMYAQGSSSTTAPTSGWATTAPAWKDGYYIWQKTVTTFGDGSTSESAATCITGATGATGTAGKGVASIVEQYYKSTSSTSQTGGSWGTSAPTWEDGYYVWARSVITYTDGSSTTTDPVCVTGSKGATGATGETGPQGETGATGERGTGIYKVTTAPSSYTTATGGFAPTYRIALSTVLTQSGATEVLVGDQLRYSYYLYPVGYVDSSYVYLDTRTSIRGSTGATGATGARGTGLLKITTALTAYTTETDGVTPSYRVALSTVTSESGVSDPMVGDTIERSYYHYPIIYVDSGYCYTGARVSIRGATGATGATGEAGSDGQMLYATSSTAAATAAKVATLASGTLTLAAGATVAVKFTYANTAANPTLNVSSTGAAAIYTNGVAYAYWEAGATVIFTYSGSYWYVCSNPVYASTATVGNPAGGNVYIDSDSVDIRSGSTALATFGETTQIGGSSNNIQIASDGIQFVNGGEKCLEIYQDGTTACIRSSYLTDGGPLCISGNSVSMTFDEYLRISSYYDSILLNGMEVFCTKVLYSNTSGSTGTITLSETAANFTFLEIQYSDGTRTMTRRVYSPNGKTVSLDRVVRGSSTTYIHCAVVTISGTSVTRVTANTGGTILTSSSTAIDTGSTYLPVTAVIGFK